METYSSQEIDGLSVTNLIEQKCNRGGVSRIVGGPSAVSYLKLNAGYSTKGKMGNVGAHQYGQLEDIPLFKVPSSVIPGDTLLTVWKNDQNEADVSIAFGTLVPFFSTGIIQRKNFYKEAGISTYGDWAVLNKRYLGLITINNIKDAVGDGRALPEAKKYLPYMTI